MLGIRLLLVTAATMVGLALPDPVSAASLSDSFDFAVNGETRYETNIGFAPDAASEREDLTTRIEGALTWRARETATQSLALGLTPFYAGVLDLTDLSHYGADLNLTFGQKFGESFSAPGVRVSVVGTWQEFADSEPRDGYRVNAELAFDWRLSPRFAAEVGYRYHLREAADDNPEGTVVGPELDPDGGLTDRRSDEVWDNERNGAYVKVDFNPTPKLGLFVEYSYMTGDIAATGDIRTFNSPEQFDAVRDFAFDEGILFQAWRIDVDQNIYVLGSSYAFNDRLSLGIDVRFLDVNGEADNDYENLVSTASFSYRF